MISGIRVDLVDDLGAGGLGEDGADGRGHHLGRASWHAGEHVAEEVDSTALPQAPAMTAAMAA
jgi:hypothetical protein